MKITIEPTGLFFADPNNTIFRRWDGIAEDGQSVQALVGGVSLPIGLEASALAGNLVPIPPVIVDRSPLYMQRLSELWLNVGHLSDKEMAAVVAFVRARAAYRNPECEERRCDRCNALYRGPATYCQLSCAIADAS